MKVAVNFRCNCIPSTNFKALRCSHRKLASVVLDVLDEDIIGSLGIKKDANSILSRHILSHERVNIVMKEVISQDLRSVCLDDGIHLCYG